MMKRGWSFGADRNWVRRRNRKSQATSVAKRSSSEIRFPYEDSFHHGSFFCKATKQGGKASRHSGEPLFNH